MSYYDEIAEGYEELHKEEQEKKIEIIKSFLYLNKEDKILDVGCGTGISTEPWKCKRYGIDPSKKLIEIARKGPIYKIATAEEIPYPDNYFDAVISITAVQNFSDIKKGLEEIRRVGKERFVITFLKKSPKKEKIISILNDLFFIEKEIEEEKDLIFYCTLYK